MRSIEQTLLLFAISLSVLGCKKSILLGSSDFVLQQGDLLFQDLDCGPLCDAIEKVTSGYERANFSHVGILAEDNSGDFVVVEAVSGGVQATPLKSFLNRSFDTKRRPKVMVGRLKAPFRSLIPMVLKEAFALKEKPYDKVFDINNDAYYCSELVYEIFLRANDNNPVFALQPMTFKDPDTGKIHSVWKNYFPELGVPIPEGQLGINPGGISRARVLTIIHAYGNPSRKPLSQK